MALADDADVRQLIELAKAEDLGGGDVSTRLLDNNERVVAFRLIARHASVFAGREIAPSVLHAYDPRVEIEWTPFGADGAYVPPQGAELATLRGPLASLLSAERVLLNFLSRLCGVATLTRSFVDAVAGTGVDIFDTRKTIPGWRALDKYAVCCGGGRNHRQGLYDAVLLKDNHLTGIATADLAAAVFHMLNRVDGRNPPAFIEVEADSRPQVEELLKVVGIDAILLDNFALSDLRQAVTLRNDLGLRGKVALEASGGITLSNVRAVAETGVERISVGAITHSAPAIDLCLERA